MLQREVIRIYTLSSYLGKVLCKEGIIEEENIEDYIYGIQITLSNLINFIIVFGIGFLTHTLLEIGLFYSIFVSIRFFCGGYHADSYGKCFSLFALTCLMYLGILNMILAFTKSQTLLLIIALAVLGICILKMAPIEHGNRPFTPDERRLFRKRAIQLYVFWSVVGIILWVERITTLSAGFISVFIIISIYMVIGGRKIHEKENA